ncbi:hypothetical protein E2F50_22160 [Rhizobium deserti]|uniref:LysR substrate-binding domain-containing protein n=1 Tax=Rhizobium deserti TaxID=2547961 RepID=A0A4R5U6N5_9HYPH|nr:hypothetical protein E2F50_22160 [Rhizobium deserti]
MRAELNANHLAIESPAVSEKLIKGGLGSRAARRNIVLRVPHYMGAPFILVETDLIAALPQPLVRAFAAQGQLVEYPLPFLTKTVVFRQFWHRRTHLDPGCMWLRRLIASQFLR